MLGGLLPICHSWSHSLCSQGSPRLQQVRECLSAQPAPGTAAASCSLAGYFSSWLTWGAQSHVAQLCWQGAPLFLPPACSMRRARLGQGCSEVRGSAVARGTG